MSAEQAKDLNIKFSQPSYDIIPMYFTMKANYRGLHKDITPYAKFDLGYAMPINFKGGKIEVGQYQAKTAEYVKNLLNNAKNIKSSAKGGVYVGASTGIEYKRFLAEIGVSYIGGSVKYNDVEFDASNVKMVIKSGIKF